MRTHYAGGLKYRTKSGWSRRILPGWAACCSGERAIAIREAERNTYERSKVDCKACLRVISESDLCNPVDKKDG